MIDVIANSKGYLYVLAVKDIDLPVCKIGMTSRTPTIRCAEINQSSTGDFIWEVAHQLAVSDCKGLESLVHEKLAPLRQRRREFFNLYPADAFQAIESILATQPEFRKLQPEDIDPLNIEAPPLAARKQKGPSRHASDTTFAHLMDQFTEILMVKGRPFGQLNMPDFGISDGRDGVQWNLHINPDDGKARVGVNLEGMEYDNWPISRFIRNELKAPTIQDLARELDQSDQVFVRFVRDAWRVQSRPAIREKHFVGGELSIHDIAGEAWGQVLEGARGCLNEGNNYLGRTKQEVTLEDGSKRVMYVSPHLTIWTPLSLDGSPTEHLSSAIDRLRPVHDWVSEKSGALIQ